VNMPKNQDDWELLSVFIDGELNSDQERAIIERFKLDADFQSMHEQLVHTRMLIAELPQVNSSRHFTLTESMLPRSLFDRFSPRLTWNFASAIASFILVIIVVADFLSFGQANLSEDQLPLEVSVAMEAAEADFAEVGDAAPEALGANAQDDFLAQSDDSAIEEERQAEITPELLTDSMGKQLDESINSVNGLFGIQFIRLAELFFGVFALFGAWMGWRVKKKRRSTNNH